MCGGHSDDVMRVWAVDQPADTPERPRAGALQGELVGVDFEAVVQAGAEEQAVVRVRCDSRDEAFLARGKGNVVLDADVRVV